MTPKEIEQRLNSYVSAIGCVTCNWQLDGPPNTQVQRIECWTMKSGRLVLIELYKDGGIDVFPQSLGGTAEQDARIIADMAAAEDIAADAVAEDG